ncbi:hypothetical protein [Candidatus Berkiella aquae]|uniref:Nucleotidyl transferase AbiEii toxin, Type IV TA system n=1 Tax=Candidatus Berkiella aquae TaxID=295108 RepID=A0A0Q9YLH1_9GAMM|nr:hypothetical protein [Candidatus Berkiella aquae]MCS5711462.1 hypothetical protein [Candidatus Berkiella aquae]
MMKTNKLANLKMLEFVAIKLGSICNDVVFLGGITTALFLTVEAYPDVRPTIDVDCIVDVISDAKYRELQKKLKRQGFKQSHQDDFTCRWRYDEVIVDIMPTDEKILTFGNRWYKSAVEHAVKCQLTDELEINLVTAPYFIATKLEAFKTRGNMDFMGSHDFEDIITVLDGRDEIVAEIEQADPELKDYLREEFSKISSRSGFLDSLPGHLVVHGSLADMQTALLKRKILQLIKLV